MSNNTYMKILKRLKQKQKSKNKQSLLKKNISTNVFENKKILEELYDIKLNADIVFRDFSMTFNNKKYACLLIFVEGLTDSDSINNFILKPLMLEKPEFHNNIQLYDFVKNEILSQGNIREQNTFEEIVKNINYGYSALLIDTLNTCYICDTKKFEHRTIDKPVNELVVKGPHESFVESLKSNVSILRRLVNNENLILEKTYIGKKNKRTCIMGYISNIANPNIIDKVRKRLQGISVDFMLNSGQLEHYIEDHPMLFEPQILSTERPDKVVSHLTEGRICIIVDNSPNVLVVPFTFWDFFHSSEDYNIKFQFANFLRLIRLVAYFFSLFLPAIYIALTSYHIYLLPTDLLFSISAIKEQIPFPLLVEILVMELSFELIREASTRMPGSIGSSLGIVGAVLLRTGYC